MKYRKISPAIWNDARVRELSDRGKLALVFLLTHPHMTPLGAIRANCPGLACELGWSVDVFRRAFEEILGQGIAREDAGATLIWFPNFLRHNMPESPNVVKSWLGGFGDLPESPLKMALLKHTARVVAGLGEGFQAAFREAFPEAFGEALPKALPEALAKGMPNQEQEQEQEQKQYRGEGGRTAFASCFEVYPVQQGREEAWRTWVRLVQAGTLARPEVIRESIVRLMAEDSRWKRGKVPNMARWLGGRGWEDKPYVEPHPEKARRPRAGSVAQKQTQDNDDMAKMLLQARRNSHAPSRLHVALAGESGSALPAGR